MDHDFDTALRAIMRDDGLSRNDPSLLTDDQRLGLFETLWEGLKKSPMEIAAEVRAALNPDYEESWREGHRKFDERGRETADLDLRDVGVKLARMVGMAGCDYIRVEFRPRRGGGPPAVRLRAIRDFGGRNVYQRSREFMEAELIRMRGDLPKHAADTFCHQARGQFEAAEEELRHGKR